MFDYSYTHEFEAANVMFIVYLLYFLTVSAVSIGTYVLQSVGFYTIAKRRGIKHPWLAWIPAGNLWILGSISDQYQYVVKGRVKNKRKALLILSILMAVACVVMYALLGAFLVQALAYDDSMLAADHAAMFNIMGTALGMMAMLFVLSGLCIAVVVIQYIALNDLYRSCEPGNSVLYLLLSIFVNITLPVFVFICRNKDLGMPPRKPKVHIPPEEPWEES